MGSRLEANSKAVRKRIERHTFEDEEGEEYEPSKFGGFADYFRRKKIKLQNLDAELRSQTSDPPIFRGIVAHVNGYTQPSLNDIHALIVSHGGGFMQYLDGKTTVTHIIASNLTPKKKVEFARYRIVKPAWVVDSVKARQLLPWDAYRVVDGGPGQRILGFDNGSVTSQVNQSQGGYRDQTDTSWYSTHVKAFAERLNKNAVQVESQEAHLHNSADPASHENASIPANSSTSSEKPSSRPSATFTAVGAPAEELLENHGHEVEDYPDPDNIPAINDSFTESLPNTQDKAQIESFGSHGSDPSKQSPKRLLTNPSEMPGSDIHQQVSEDITPGRDDLLKKNSSFKEDAAELNIDSLTGLTEHDNFGEDFAISTEITEAHAKREVPEPILPTGKSFADMTPEEHNALLLADPRIRKSTVVNPAFLKQYYEESRLHHLSAWKASLKSQLQALAAEKSLSQKARQKRPAGSRRYILHVDFDSFFAAVSLKKFPQYVDKPVVIAHGNGAGAEIASSNYPAREFGIQNGMWMKNAIKMCPELKVLPYDFKAYEEASRHFYEAIIDTNGVVQSVSVDEALIDVSTQCLAAGGQDDVELQESSTRREQDKADEIAQALRDEVKGKTGCAVSIGIGGNILLAKVALRRAKPAGQYQIKPEDALDFLAGLKMQDLPGIAWSIGGKLEEVGVKFVRDVRSLTKERMISILGPKTGRKIWDYSRGIDQTEVGEQVVRKSVSAEVNWGIRFVTQDQAEEFVQSLCDELHKRLVNEGVKGRQLTMKIMRRSADAPRDPPKHLGHGKCDTFNKSVALGVATNEARVLGREAISILRGWGFSPGELRGIGCQMQKLEPIKGLPESLHDSSQKRLQFTKHPATKLVDVDDDETAAEEIETPPKPKNQMSPHPASAFARDTSPSGRLRAPLNTLGTQFVLPTQVDAATLAELPQDIRKKLFPGQSRHFNDRSALLQPEANASEISEAFPSVSQIDPDALDALPQDIRAEILAQYHKSPAKLANQAVLPQSPRKDRTIKVPKKLTTPTKKRGRPLGAANKTFHTAPGFSTLTQSNFVATGKSNHAAAAAITTTTSATEDLVDTTPEISAEFLSALPDDIRHEVLAQARRERLKKKGGIDLSETSIKRRQQHQLQQQRKENLPPPGQRTLKLPPQSAKPTFTSQRLSSLPDLRKAITAWFEEFCTEGPYAEDVQALMIYLEKVVREEKDMSKAVAVASWLKWVVERAEPGSGGDENDDDDADDPKQKKRIGTEAMKPENSGADHQDRNHDKEEEQISWKEAVIRVQNSVHRAVQARGLGPVEF